MITTTEQQLMMSQMTTPLSNTKRYWGEEENIDSIYSIYIKKICYTYSSDASVYASTNGDEASSSSTSTNRRNSQDDRSRRTPKSVSQKHSISNNDLAKQQYDSHKKKEDTPRNRKNFFQKYRRRSCSVDKYSFEKAHERAAATMTGTTTSKSKSRYGLSSPPEKKTDGQPLTPSDNNDQYNVDRVASKKSSNGQTLRIPPASIDSEISRSDSSSSKNSSTRINVSGYKSISDISTQAQAQSLLWETRQIKILQAATLDHVIKFILLINSNQNRDHLSINSSNPSAASPVAEIASTNSTNSSTGDDAALDEERNNVAHITHVFFCTYRIYTNPYELMLKLMLYSDICRIEQYRFVMLYWMDNYPEDFDYIVEGTDNGSHEKTSTNDQHNVIMNDSIGNTSFTNPSMNSCINSVVSCEGSASGQTNATTDSETNTADGGNINATASIGSRLSTSADEEVESQLNRRWSNLSLSKTKSSNKDSIERLGVPLVNELLRLSQDEHIRKRALKLLELRRGPASTNGSIDSTDSETFGRYKSPSSRHHHRSSKNSAVLDLDSRYVAQQLTAIDLENFLSLRSYSLLDGSKSDKRIQSMIRNFNLLSRHVVVTILKSHNPNIVAAHWIAIAMNLRRIKNFNSLKAIIAGLTNESVYRLKQLVWNKIDRISLANFKLLASIVDDVNNQIVLRQTQLVIEGTAKMSIEDDSFGTIPYLGTFLTDLNMIDARYQSYVPSPKDETSKLKLINFEKCAKQFEILAQVQLLQKNVLASLHAIQRRNNFDEHTTLNRLKLEQFNQNHQMLSAKPLIPKVSRLFENWFFDDDVSATTDKQCYEMSVNLEKNVAQK